MNPRTHPQTPVRNAPTASRRHMLGLLAAGTSFTALSGQTRATGVAAVRQTTQPVTALFGLVRKAGMSHDEFADYFLNTHIPLTKQKLQDEGVNLLAYRSILPLVPADGPFDGVGEITFEDGAAFQHVTVSDGWQAAIADVANFTTPDQNVVVVGVEQDHLQMPTDRATTTDQ